MHNSDKLPKPKLIIQENGEPFVTDGYIQGSKFIVKQQPSMEIVDKLHQFFVEQAKKTRVGGDRNGINKN